MQNKLRSHRWLEFLVSRQGSVHQKPVYPPIQLMNAEGRRGASRDDRHVPAAPHVFNELCAFESGTCARSLDQVASSINLSQGGRGESASWQWAEDGSTCYGGALAHGRSERVDETKVRRARLATRTRDRQPQVRRPIWTGGGSKARSGGGEDGEDRCKHGSRRCSAGFGRYRSWISLKCNSKWQLSAPINLLH